MNHIKFFLRQWVDKQTHLDVVPMAFDMEWPFTFQTGPGKSAVIQICVDEKCCYVFQLTKLKKLPTALMALLKHPKVRLHGVNIKLWVFILLQRIEINFQ